jgi:hypothetical protein
MIINLHNYLLNILKEFNFHFHIVKVNFYVIKKKKVIDYQSCRIRYLGKNKNKIEIIE